MSTSPHSSSSGSSSPASSPASSTTHSRSASPERHPVLEFVGNLTQSMGRMSPDPAAQPPRDAIVPLSAANASGVTDEYEAKMAVASKDKVDKLDAINEEEEDDKKHQQQQQKQQQQQQQHPEQHHQEGAAAAAADKAQIKGPANPATQIAPPMPPRPARRVSWADPETVVKVMTPDSSASSSAATSPAHAHIPGPMAHSPTTKTTFSAAGPPATITLAAAGPTPTVSLAAAGPPPIVSLAAVGPLATCPSVPLGLPTGDTQSSTEGVVAASAAVTGHLPEESAVHKRKQANVEEGVVSPPPPPKRLRGKIQENEGEVGAAAQGGSGEDVEMEEGGEEGEESGNLSGE